MRLFKKVVTSGVDMPKCKKPKSSDEIKEIFQGEDITITADEKSIDVDIERNDGSCNGIYANQRLDKKQALEMADSIIEYYATKHI